MHLINCVCQPVFQGQQAADRTLASETRHWYLREARFLQLRLVKLKIDLEMWLMASKQKQMKFRC